MEVYYQKQMFTNEIYTDRVQSNLNCWNKFSWCKFYYYPIVNPIMHPFLISFCTSYCSPVHLNRITVQCWITLPIFIKILYAYSCFMPICLHFVTLTSCNSSHQILNNTLLTFGPMPFGWLNTRTLWTGYNTTQNYVGRRRIHCKLPTTVL